MDKATKKITLRLTPEQYTILHEMADRYQFNDAEMIRHCLAHALRVNGWPQATIERGNPDFKSRKETTK